MRRLSIAVVVTLVATPTAWAQSSLGMWTSEAELASEPTSGPAWDALLHAADQDTSDPDVADQDDPTNVRVLAAAIVYARTRDTTYRTKVVDALETLVARGHPGGRTLAWARETGAYVLAADLAGYRTAAFETWLASMADAWLCSDLRITLRAMFERRPNNWGTHAFGALCAIYRYLGDTTSLSAVRAYWIQGLLGPNPGYDYGSDMSWHLDPGDPRTINPPGAVKNGLVIDGFAPDDMRRGGPFQDPPVYTGYAWECLQGLVQAARILERAGMPIWDAADRAIHRAAYALQVRLGGAWEAEGDDLWMLAFLDHAYGTTWSGSQDVFRAGKNAGWAYVLGPSGPAPAAPPPVSPQPPPSSSPPPATPHVSVIASDALASERGPNVGKLTIGRTGSTAAALVVAYTVGGTAIGGADYVTVSGSATIAPGASSVTVEIVPVDDSAVEYPETVVLTVGTGAGYDIGAPSSAAVTIRDNDAQSRRRRLR